MNILGRDADVVFGDGQYYSKFPEISPQVKAMTLVQEYIEAGLRERDDKPEYDIFVTWFTKTLKNWKALLGSTLPDQEYYEVTYDGEKRKTYVDVYIKHANIEIPD